MLTKTEQSYFNAAKKAATLSDFGKVSIGVAVIYKHKVIAVAANSIKTKPIQQKWNRYRFESKTAPAKLHAEIAALYQLQYLDIDFSDVELYIYRQLKDGSLAMARPCASCMAYIKSLCIQEIHYTTYDGYADERIIYEE